MDQVTPLTAAIGAKGEEETIPVFDKWFGSWRISVRRRALSTLNLTQAYDRVAPAWSRMLDRFGFPAAYEAVFHRLLSQDALASFVPDGTGQPPHALDCGAGTGALSCAFARAMPSPFRFDAIDISPRMLNEARHHYRNAGLAVTLTQGDLSKLPYADDTFDLVMGAHVLEHLVDPGAALREMVRVLKPGGLAMVCVTRRSPFGLYLHFKWRTRWVTADQAETWLRESGLRNARCVSFEVGMFRRRVSVACIGTKPGDSEVFGPPRGIDVLAHSCL